MDLFIDFFPARASTSTLPVGSMAASPQPPVALSPVLPPYSNLVPPIQYNPFSTPFREPPPTPTLDPEYQSTTVDDFLKKIEEHDPRRHLTEYASRFRDLGYLDLSEIFWMDVQTLKASTGMPEGVAHLVRRTMDECQRK